MKKHTVGNEASELGAAATKRNSAHMLPVCDWLSDLPENNQLTDLIEVQFKNTRKGYFHNSANLPLEKGVKVVVEANPGYDVGEVVLTGKLVELQIKKNKIDASRYEIRQVIRIATEEDLQKAAEAHAREHETMIKARELAKSLGLEMKIGDVEYQGDGSKAIFFYIADGRVDFRQLIKVYAETFRIRVEMKQIGARQEAGRIGGTGPCGRELCCSTWMINFSSVGTGAARLQNISPNPQKLAGMCAKLKCCLNYEVSNYMDAHSRIPKVSEPLEFEDGLAYLVKTDILAETMYFSYEKGSLAKMYPLPASEVREIIMMNRNGQKPETLLPDAEPTAPEFVTAVGDDSISRFDEARKKKRRNKNRNNKNKGNKGGNPKPKKDA